MVLVRKQIKHTFPVISTVVTNKINQASNSKPTVTIFYYLVSLCFYQLILREVKGNDKNRNPSRC